MSARSSLLLCCALFAGCVSVDPRAFREAVSKEATATVNAEFSNWASYRSKGEFQASDTLSGALGLYLEGANTVHVSRPTPDTLALRFSKDGREERASTTYRLKEGLAITQDGKFELTSKMACGDRDSPIIGCGSKTVTLFVNAEGDLVAVESGAGGGVIGVIPFAMYAKLVAVYSRRKPDR
jgi:hypothetical protein